MSKQDGGPAFPLKNLGLYPGLTIRDYFAGQALAGMLANTDIDKPPGPLAEDAYMLADAMLAERDVP